MGYADLDDPIRRKASLLKWLREFGFTTTDIVRCVGLLHIPSLRSTDEKASSAALKQPGDLCGEEAFTDLGLAPE